jgi:hypothetical protein
MPFDGILGLLPGEAASVHALSSRDAAHDRKVIARLNRHAQRDPKSQCLVWKGGKKGEYGVIHHQGKTYRAHRLCYIAHNGPIPHGLYVCHVCDNPSCVAIEHLFLGTPRDNVMDMRRKGRGNVKYSEAQIAAVKRRLADGATRMEAAREVGVNFHLVQKISSGRMWAHVAPAPKGEVTGE